MLFIENDSRVSKKITQQCFAITLEIHAKIEAILSEMKNPAKKSLMLDSVVGNPSIFNKKNSSQKVTDARQCSRKPFNI